MRKRTLLSNIKAVKKLVLLTVYTGSSFRRRSGRQRQQQEPLLKSKSQMDTWLFEVRRLLTKAMRSDS
mgnify:CR=1 FL=1